MVRRLIQSLHPASVPHMSRPSYQRELAVSLTMPAALALVEGGVVGVMAKKVFDVGPAQLAMITAAPMFANLTSFAWARLARGRRRTPVLTGILIALLMTVSTVALLPVSHLGGWLLTALVVLARVLIVGQVTVRSTIWRHNYPRHVRGRIIARLIGLLAFALLVAPLAGAILLDANPMAFRVLYPLGAAVAVIGVYNYSRIRVRSERALLREELADGAGLSGSGGAETEAAGAMTSGAGGSTGRGRSALGDLASVFRGDPLFRDYLLCQFFAGLANMMADPVLIDLVATRTDGLRGDFMISIGITSAAPALMMVLTLPLWARLLDRMHVSRFRVCQSWLWVSTHLMCWVAVTWTGSLLTALLLLAAGRLLLGAAKGAGVLAWNLGHNDFATREMAGVYMGVHVTLTGIRGCFAPFLGMALYTGWPRLELGPLALPAFAGLGGHLFALSVISATISMVGFWILARRIHASRGLAPALD